MNKFIYKILVYWCCYKIITVIKYFITLKYIFFFEIHMHSILLTLNTFLNPISCGVNINIVCYWINLKNCNVVLFNL